MSETKSRFQTSPERMAKENGESILKGALVGFGKAAVQAHLPAFHHQKIAIVAVVETAPERCAAVHSLLPQAHIYTSLTDCLQHEDLDFVDVVTPPTSHGQLVIEICQRGLHVLCEKPLTLSVQELETIKSLAMAKDLVVFTVHNWKHAPQFRLMREWIKKGRIGKPLYIELQTFRQGPALGHPVDGQRADWRLDPRLSGGGILIDHGWHAFYLLLDLCDQLPQSLSAILSTYAYSESAVEDTVDCWVHFPAAIGRIYLTWAAYTRLNLALVWGSEGVVYLQDRQVQLYCPSMNLVESFSFPEAVSAHSYHPDWMVPLLEDFQREINDYSIRGTNLREAEACLLLTLAAYHSG